MVVDLVDGVASIVGQVHCGYVYVDGSTVGDVTESSLKDRRILGDEGFISITVVVDSVTGKLTGGPVDPRARLRRGRRRCSTTCCATGRGGARAAPAATGIDDTYQLQQVSGARSAAG